jgi:hypothetical protein
VSSDQRQQIDKKRAKESFEFGCGHRSSSRIAVSCTAHAERGAGPP